MLVGSLNMFVCKELFRSLVFLVEHFKSYIRTEDMSFSLHIGDEFDFGSGFTLHILQDPISFRVSNSSQTNSRAIFVCGAGPLPVDVRARTV